MYDRLRTRLNFAPRELFARRLRRRRFAITSRERAAGGDVLYFQLILRVVDDRGVIDVSRRQHDDARELEQVGVRNARNVRLRYILLLYALWFTRRGGRAERTISFVFLFPFLTRRLAPY